MAVPRAAQRSRPLRRWPHCWSASIPSASRPCPRHRLGLGQRITGAIAAERRTERRRRTRLRLGLASAAAAVVAAAVVAVVGMVGSDQSTPSQTVAFRSLPRDTFAEATLAPRPWGSEVSVKVYGFRTGTLCQVWLRRSDGKRVPAGSFRYADEGEGEHLSSALAPDDATAVGLRIGSRTYVAPLPPTPAPTLLDGPKCQRGRVRQHLSERSG